MPIKPIVPAPKSAPKSSTLRPGGGGPLTNGNDHNGQNGHNGQNDHQGLDKKKLYAALLALKQGDFNVCIDEDWIGLDGKIASVFNEVVGLNRQLSKELEKVGRIVGKEGKILQRSSLGPVDGGWAKSVESLNGLIDDLISPTTEMTRIIGAVANGDLSQTVSLDMDGRPLRGEFLRSAKTVNSMVSRLSAFASEATRVVREVGTEGKLGGQADVKGVAGTWKELTDNVNLMASNLRAPMRNIGEVAVAIANGDLSKKITADAKGEILELKNTINATMDQLNAFASEVSRVAREVGTEGKLGGQADVKGVSGLWNDLTDNVNSMAANLTSQVRNIAQVTTAVANGDLSKKITAEAKGEILELKETINTMVDQLNSFASEVSRVAREVGSEGKLGGQAEVLYVGGVWKDLTYNVNSMAANLTGQVRNIVQVTTALSNGDFSKRFTVEGKGELLELKNTINSTVDQLNSFASEVTRVAREVGTEGKLGGQAEVKGVAGTWKDLTDNVNSMASNLTGQVRNIVQVTTAVANGDFSKKFTVEGKGEILELKNTVNSMVDQLNSFASEVTRVVREVGTEGKLGGQVEVKGVAGLWKDLTDSVNYMASNLKGQVRNIAEVVTAIANGDLSTKITTEAKGEILELKNTVNASVDQLNSFASEVTRVAREVGSEGKLGGLAQVKGVAGTWKDLTDNVNFMASNLTGQVRNIAQVTTAVADGDLTKKITVDVNGEMLDLKRTINTMVDQLNSFASEVTRVVREVGTEGKLGGQAEVRDVGGVWKDLTDSVNFMASNVTGQVRNIVQVTTAVANGDFSKKFTVDVKGEILELKTTINSMVDQLNSLTSEVSRVVREVGSEGKLGGQAQVKGVAGTWKDLTDNVNVMASNLTGQVRNIAEVTISVANGDLSKKITVDVRGEFLQLKDRINTMVDQLRTFASEVTRVAREVGTEGKLGGQAYVQSVAGTWKDLTDNVNFMASNLTGQVRNIAQVTTGVANGDLSKKITVEVKGEILELKNTINSMVDQLSSFASEVSRVAREVGTEGRLGGQAQVKGVAGTWKDLTDNVNFMAGNLTTQVRVITKVVTSVANGDLKQKLAFEAKGEIASLADTINGMIDTLATFADQVTTVAREVGVEGRLGGQASVPGAAGTWKGLTFNVNQLAANLTTQVRAIADVATAVTKGDFTRSIQVDAQGEVEGMKDTINQMIVNLRETTLKNAEQDWLKTNLAKFTLMLQGQKDLFSVTKQILAELAPVVTAQHGVFYLMQNIDEEPVLKLMSSYAYKERRLVATEFKLGEGLVGQCALEKERILLTHVPTDYIMINSGLGESPPLSIIVLPVIFEGDVKAVIELASFERFSATHQIFLEQLTESIGIVLNTIEANMRTVGLLKQSQTQAQELQSQQAELRMTNSQLEEKAMLLVEQKAEVERQNREVEQAKGALEEKANQLSLTSKYKSEFLANMSHELRTPLNSLLILAQQLGDNVEGNLHSKQVQFAQTIYSAGSDLLTLINDILDLSKIESGTVTVEPVEISFLELQTRVDRTFRHMAESKGLEFHVTVEDDLPGYMVTDLTRLHQVLKNLLSNSFKFTARGQVDLSIHLAKGGWSPAFNSVYRSKNVVAFSVTDTGIGIHPDKQQLIFEAFQQADGTTSRKYGGTGLGLSISREIARLLGGEIRLTSVPGEGSTFTLFLPLDYKPGPKPGNEDPAGHLAGHPAGYPGAEYRRETPPRESYLRKNAGRELPVPEEMSDRHMEPVEQGHASQREKLMDDRKEIVSGDRVVMIVEDDDNFAFLLLGVAREKGFKALVVPLGSQALPLAREYQPDAITLDLHMPDMDGWSILARLKEDSTTRHIPVHIISVEEERDRGLRQGAISFLTKPMTKETLDESFKSMQDFIARETKSLLVVEDNEIQRQAILELVADSDVDVVAVATGAAALEQLRSRPFDCMVMDIGLPDMDGFALIEEIKKDPDVRGVPIVVYTCKELTTKEESQLREVARTIIIKDVRSPERLLDETSLFLHRVQKHMPEHKRKMLEQLHKSDALLMGKKILVVDDDIRNIFAMTSLLERHGMVVISAENGRDAVEVLGRIQGVDAVLMDIMMPEMDGYETMRVIREMQRFQALPIIALTAKAMKGDREKCIEAGASDYISKPVDTEQLLSLLRVWVYR